jgi:hypothetical protein
VTFTVVTVLQVTYGLMMFSRDRMPSNGTRRDTRILAAVSYLGRNRPMGYLLVGVTHRRPRRRPGHHARAGLRRRARWRGDLVGLITSAFGVGAILGFVVQPAPTPHRTGALGHARPGRARGRSRAPRPRDRASVAVGTMLVAGTGMTLSLTAFTTAIQQRVPDALRGRIMALWSIAFLGSRPLAAALSGVLSDVAARTSRCSPPSSSSSSGAVLSRPSLTRERTPEPSVVSEERFAGPRPA